MAPVGNDLRFHPSTGGTASHEAAVEIRKQLQSDLDMLEAMFLALALVIPPDKYSWSPARGVRCVEEVFVHVASECRVYPRIAAEAPPSLGVGRGPDPVRAFEATSSRADVYKHLKEAFAYAREALIAIDPAQLTGSCGSHDGGRTIIQTVLAITCDLHEHLGQLIAYARMNGVTPPWST